MKSCYGILLGVALLSLGTAASAAIISTTGQANTGDLDAAGDSVSGVMNIDGTLVDYTINLTAENVVGPILWNGPGRSEPNGFSWDDGSSAGNSWTLELTFSQPVNLVFDQSGIDGIANEPGSFWTIAWDSNGPTSISDPDNQLDDPFTNAGPGLVTFSSTARILNNNATWNIFGPASSTYTISWYNTINGPGTDAIGIDAQLTTIPVPAALPLFGSGLAGLGFLGWRRRNS